MQRVIDWTFIALVLFVLLAGLSVHPIALGFTALFVLYVLLALLIDAIGSGVLRALKSGHSRPQRHR